MKRLFSISNGQISFDSKETVIELNGVHISISLTSLRGNARTQGRILHQLVIALRTAVENGEGMLDKDATSHDDLFDAFRLSLMFWH
jgi:hypothetical protein